MITRLHIKNFKSLEDFWFPSEEGPFGLGQNARTTGGAGILPAAMLQQGSSLV